MGMIKGETFKTRDAKYVAADLVEAKDSKYFLGDEEIFKEFEKMSKSKLNGVDPGLMISKYGIDFTRLFLVNFVHPKSDRNFSLSSDMVDGTKKIFERIWKLILKAESCGLSKLDDFSEADLRQMEKLNQDIYNIRNIQLSMITYNLDANFNFPSYIVAVSKIIKFLVSVPEKHYNENYMKLLKEMLIVFSPIIPHFTCECWEIVRPLFNTSDFDTEKSVLEQNWPQIDENWEIELNLKVKGKKQLKKLVPKNIIEKMSKEEAIKLFQEMMMDSENKAATNIDFKDYEVVLESNLPLHMSLILKKLKKD